MNKLKQYMEGLHPLAQKIVNSAGHEAAIKHYEKLVLSSKSAHEMNTHLKTISAIRKDAKRKQVVKEEVMTKNMKPDTLMVPSRQTLERQSYGKWVKKHLDKARKERAIFQKAHAAGKTETCDNCGEIYIPKSRHKHVCGRGLVKEEVVVSDTLINEQTRKLVRKTYLGVVRGTTKTGQKANPINLSPTIEIKRKKKI